MGSACSGHNTGRPVWVHPSTIFIRLCSHLLQKEDNPLHHMSSLFLQTEDGAWCPDEYLGLAISHIMLKATPLQQTFHCLLIWGQVMVWPRKLRDHLISDRKEIAVKKWTDQITVIKKASIFCYQDKIDMQSSWCLVVLCCMDQSRSALGLYSILNLRHFYGCNSMQDFSLRWWCSIQNMTMIQNNTEVTLGQNCECPWEVQPEPLPDPDCFRTDLTIV